MVRLFPTPPEKLVDGAGRPYFLCDSDMTLTEFGRRLKAEPPAGRAYLVGKLMRQGKPDEVFTFVTVEEFEELWPQLERYLGKQRGFWRWLLKYWGCDIDAAQPPCSREFWRCLLGVEPPWTLTGGGALAGFHLGHRSTRDLALF